MQFSSFSYKCFYLSFFSLSRIFIVVHYMEMSLSLVDPSLRRMNTVFLRQPIWCGGCFFLCLSFLLYLSFDFRFFRFRFLLFINNLGLSTLQWTESLDVDPTWEHSYRIIFLFSLLLYQIPHWMVVFLDNRENIWRPVGCHFRWSFDF